MADGIDYQHDLTVKQANNEKQYGEEFGNPELIKAAEKRIKAAREATPSDPFVESTAGGDIADSDVQRAAKNAAPKKAEDG